MSRRTAGRTRAAGSTNTHAAPPGRAGRAGGGGGAHDLQRSAGNQAIQAIHRRPAPEAAPAAHAGPYAENVAAPAVQRMAEEQVPDTTDARAAANAGVAGDATRLPHEATIQRAFGPEHDLSTIRAHVGGAAGSAARALGASAYTLGNQVAFGSAPSLWLSAHEAAHAVQQRAGVHLANGMGQEGDPYERAANAVADRVVHDEPADDLLPDLEASTVSEGVQQQKAPAAPTDDQVRDAWTDDLAEWDELQMVTEDPAERAYAHRVFLLLNALPAKIKTVAAYDQYYEQAKAAARDEYATLDIVDDVFPQDEVLIENGDAFPNVWADKIERETRGLVDIASAADSLADVKRAALDRSSPIAPDVWARGLPLTFEEARRVTMVTIIGETLTFASTRSAATEPTGRYARALLAWARAEAYLKFSVSYKSQLRSRIGEIRRGDLVVDRAAYQELLGTGFLEFKRVLLDSAISDPDHLGKSMAALILNTPGQFYRVVGSGIKYEWPAEGRAAFLTQLNLVETQIIASIFPEQKIWRAFLWAHERNFLSAAGREAWEAIKDNALTMLAMVVAIIIAQAIPGVNIAVDLALIVMFGWSILDAVFQLASALKAIITARTVADMERVSAGLATVLAGTIAELFITAATWGMGRAAKYFAKVKKAEKYLQKHGNSKEAEDVLRRSGGNVDEAEKILQQRRAAERREAERQRQEAKRKAYEQERERLRREKQERQRAEADARRERAEAEAREREQRQAADKAERERREAEKQKREAAEKAERERRQAAEKAEREEREAAARKAREEAQARRRQERQEAADKKARERQEAAERRRQAEEQKEAKRKLDEQDAQRREAERADLARQRAANLDEIAAIDREIAKHEARRKGYAADADRIRSERKTADWEAKAANKDRQARNEAGHRDEWQEKRRKPAGDNDRINREIAKSRIGPRPSQPHGGSYDEIPTAGGQVNHIPPQSVLPARITYGKGPAVWMETADHMKTSSWGSGAIKAPPQYPYKTAEQWRAAQQDLINKGKLKEAVQMDIDDIRFKFGSKYERGIGEMLAYIQRSGF